MIATTTVWCLTVALAMTVVIVLNYDRLQRYRSYQTPELDDSALPRAAIILCLRGSDPFLDECLAQLTNQDYPEYELWIVLDSPQDRAGVTARRWQARSRRARVHITYLNDISIYTSLKCNALMHGIKQLDETIQAVVLVDADTITYPRWLRNMVSPLVGGDVGCVTGSRWYDPSSRCWGSQLRFVYNAYALVPMYMMNAIWPGSLSLRREVFADPILMMRLSQAPCEDDAILRTLRDSNLRLLNTPECVMLNREECSVGSCFNFVRRQLLWTRLSNAAWNWVLVGTAAVYGWLIGGLVLLGTACAYGPASLALGLAAFMLAAWVVNLALLVGLHRTVSQLIARSAGVAPIAVSWRAGLQLAVCQLLVISFYTIAAVSAALVRRVRWRGVSYRVQSSSQRIEMEGYAPYEAEEVYAVANHSL